VRTPGACSWEMTLCCAALLVARWAAGAGAPRGMPRESNPIAPTPSACWLHAYLLFGGIGCSTWRFWWLVGLRRGLRRAECPVSRTPSRPPRQLVGFTPILSSGLGCFTRRSWWLVGLPARAAPRRMPRESNPIAPTPSACWLHAYLLFGWIGCSTWRFWWLVGLRRGLRRAECPVSRTPSRPPRQLVGFAPRMIRDGGLRPSEPIGHRAPVAPGESRRHGPSGRPFPRHSARDAASH
jgi:hypothetical protein